jgi:hypothetical protein
MASTGKCEYESRRVRRVKWRGERFTNLVHELLTSSLLHKVWVGPNRDEGGEWLWCYSRCDAWILVWTSTLYLTTQL